MKIKSGDIQDNFNDKPVKTEKHMWIGWILSAIVLFLFILLGLGLKNPVRLLLTGKKTTGIVIVTTKENDNPVQPVFQFVTSSGEQVNTTPRTSFGSSFQNSGEKVTLLYDPQKPHTILLLSWREFSGMLIFLGIIVFVVYGWLSALLIAPDLGLDDPLHILSFIIARLKLSPTYFPLSFLFSLWILVIFACGAGMYTNLKTVYELKTHGIKATGVVTGSVIENSDNAEGSSSGRYNTISFTDLSGKEYTIRESRTTTISPLNEGDSVEVIYSPDNPKGGMINRWFEFYPAALFFGFCFIAFATPLLLLLKRKIFP